MLLHGAPMLAGIAWLSSPRLDGTALFQLHINLTEASLSPLDRWYKFMDLAALAYPLFSRSVKRELSKGCHLFLCDKLLAWGYYATLGPKD